MIDWIIKNKEWVFSGIGILILSALVKFFLGIVSKNDKSKSIKQNQKISGKGTGVQAGGDVNIS